MRKFYAFAIAAVMGCGAAMAETHILDLTKSTTPLEFNAEDGSWTGTYTTGEYPDLNSIESQVFSFIHGAMEDYDMWWGFTASNSADNSMRSDYITYQFSNMAKGGIELGEDGKVKLDAKGAPVVNAAVPYLVSYYSAYYSRRPVDLIFNTGKNYKPVSCYINLNSYAYYTVEQGNAFSAPFSNTDKFTLTIHGVQADGSAEKTLEVVLASMTNGDLTINRGWRLVDLSSLGTVNELYFTLDSTDSGAWGMNTPGYFCLDKLCVEDADSGAANELSALAAAISYDRDSKTVTYTGAEYAGVYDINGRQVMASETGSIDLTGLETGVYLVKAGSSSLKILK